jgi:hypothetical protein
MTRITRSLLALNPVRQTLRRKKAFIPRVCAGTRSIPILRLHEICSRGMMLSEQGGRFIDFSLPDLEGTAHTLSDIIGSKYALFRGLRR